MMESARGMLETWIIKEKQELRFFKPCSLRSWELLKPRTEIEPIRRLARRQAMMTGVGLGQVNLRGLWSVLLEMPNQPATKHNNLESLGEGWAAEFWGY